MKCPDCNYDKDIRREYLTEADGSTLVYYRCKDCAYMWDFGEFENCRVIDNER